MDDEVDPSYRVEEETPDAGGGVSITGNIGVNIYFYL